MAATSPRRKRTNPELRELRDELRQWKANAIKRFPELANLDIGKA